MKCENVHPLLYRLLEDRLLADDAETVREHVDQCSTCRARFERIAVLDESALEAEDERPSPRLRPALLAAYRRQMAVEAASPTLWWGRMAGMRRAAAIALVAFISSGGTWLTLREDKQLPVHSPVVTTTRPNLDGLFPLLISDSFTIVHEDGRVQRGSRTQIVQ